MVTTETNRKTKSAFRRQKGTFRIFVLLFGRWCRIMQVSIKSSLDVHGAVESGGDKGKKNTAL